MSHMRNWPDKFFTIFCFAVFVLLSVTVTGSTVNPGGSFTQLVRPLIVEKQRETGEALVVRVDQSSYESLRSSSKIVAVEFPLSPLKKVELELERFAVTVVETRFVIGTSSGDIETDGPEVILYRGSVYGEPGSHAFLAISSTGMAHGSVTLGSGETYFLSEPPEEAAKGWNGRLTIHKLEGSIDLPEGVKICGVEVPADFTPKSLGSSSRSIVSGLRIADVAIEGDQMYYNLFGNMSLAQSYALTLMGAVTDIYIRDLRLKLLVKYMRIWPYGGEPFSADDLGSLADHWYTNENPSLYNYVHLLSGRRDLPYGGVAFLGGTCSGNATYSIGGFLNGSFPNPFDTPSNANWDVIVVAHEMGHNGGTYHTHDGYSPTIDDCGNGVPSRGTIMSYCHIHAGYASNIDMHMHRRVEEVILEDLAFGNCMAYDCNGNDTSDALDISLGHSADVNGNGKPDECEDCNNNGILDPTDITMGAPDVNVNGIPDACEANCNGNALPDAYEIELSMVTDDDGNNVPDNCDPDCDNNSIPDFAEIASGSKDDFDRNNIPDVCQDCNSNGTTDWLDLGREHNLYVADLADRLSEFHAKSGYPIQYLAAGSVANPQDLVFGADRKLYVSSSADNRVARINIDNGTVTTFVSSGSGGLSFPTGLTFGPNGNLFVASRGTSSVIQYNGTTGALISTFVSSGSGGLTQPYGITFGPNGNLFVASSNNAIIQYNGSTGALVGVFVSPGSGGLSAPRGITFHPNGNLLVASNAADQILEYNGTTGSPVRVFNDLQTPFGPWGLRIGPNGHVFVAENSNVAGTPRVIEYFPTGRYYRRFVRGNNSGLSAPTGIAFAPTSSLDCNKNGQLDICDINLGVSLDGNLNQIPDECESGDGDGDGIANALDNCPSVSNPTQSDLDEDGRGDLCDNCKLVANFSQADGDGDAAGDLCDNCPSIPNSNQLDADGDKIGDLCDSCTDLDDDGYGNPGYPASTCPADNCPFVANPGQEDADSDGTGDLCDDCTDTDSDGYGNPGYPASTCQKDNCPVLANPDQADADLDSVGNVCDNCPTVYNPSQADGDHDGIGDACEFLCGDANQTGFVNIADVVYVIAYIFNSGPAPNPLTSGDVNCNGIVNVADVVYLIQYIFGNGPDPCASC